MKITKFSIVILYFEESFASSSIKKSAPTRNTYLNVINKFKKLGTVENRAKPGRPRSVTADAKIEYSEIEYTEI